METSNSSHTTSSTTSERAFPLDLLRGLIIIFMALDHANYFIAQQHASGEHWGGPMPTFPTTLAFLTRLVTHFCAPGFFFLMGIGMVLFADSRRQKGWSEGRIIRHFLFRGSFLIILQITLINFFWRSGPIFFPNTYIGVLIALGGGMILCSFVLRLRPLPLLVLASLFFVGTELLHLDPSMWNQITQDAPNLILLRSGGTSTFWSNYPILPWVELILFGMAIGKWFKSDQKLTYRRAAIVGLVFLTGFVVLRLADGFGNIRPRAGDQWIDFFNLVKYPPSMTFTLFTIGVNLLLLWLFSRISERALQFFRPVAVFGKAPLFVYIVHLPLYLVLGRWLTPNGTSLGVMYVIWLFGLVLLYPLTLWYARFKHRQAPDSLLRFL